MCPAAQPHLPGRKSTARGRFPTRPTDRHGTGRRRDRKERSGLCLPRRGRWHDHTHFHVPQGRLMDAREDKRQGASRRVPAKERPPVLFCGEDPEPGRAEKRPGRPGGFASGREGGLCGRGRGKRDRRRHHGIDKDGRLMFWWEIDEAKWRFLPPWPSTPPPICGCSARPECPRPKPWRISRAGAEPEQSRLFGS